MKQSGTRLSNIEAIAKTLVNHSLNLIGLRDASASKNIDRTDVFRVAFMRTFQKVLFLQPAYLFSTQNATQRNSTFKVYPELEQLQKAVRRDSVLFLFASRIGKMIPWKGFWRVGRGRRYLPLT